MSKKHTSYKDYFYMCQKTVEIRDIYNAIDTKRYDVELWEAAGIIEIGLEDKRSIDVEYNQRGFTDEEDKAFLHKYSISSIYNIHFALEDDNEVRGIFKNVITKYGGFLCSDSYDFKPFILVGQEG